MEYCDRFPQDAKDIVQIGRCPEGSTGQCPKWHAHNQDSIAEIREHAFDSLVPDSVAIIPTCGAQFQDDLLVEAVTIGIELPSRTLSRKPRLA